MGVFGQGKNQAFSIVKKNKTRHLAQNGVALQSLTSPNQDLVTVPALQKLNLKPVNQELSDQR